MRDQYPLSCLGLQPPHCADQHITAPHNHAMSQAVLRPDDGPVEVMSINRYNLHADRSPVLVRCRTTAAEMRAIPRPAILLLLAAAALLWASAATACAEHGSRPC